MAEYLSAFIHIYIVIGMDPAQLLHVVVKQAGKLYFNFTCTWSQTKTQVFTLCSQNTCMQSKAVAVRATCLCHLLINLANSLDLDKALHLGPDLDLNSLTLWCFFLNLIWHTNKTNIIIS